MLSQENVKPLQLVISSVDRNQTAVIKGIIQKATSPAILTRYSAVMDTVSDMFLTNIPSSAISDLVKLQLSNSTP